MKVNKYICLVATVAIAMITAVSSAQSGSKTIPQAVAQDATSYVIDGTDGGMVVGEMIMPAQPAFESGSEVIGSGCYSPAPVIQGCDCCESSCTRCRSKRQRPACRCKRLGCQGECASTPMFQSCEGDFCKLSVKHGKEKKTCFKTEQVPVCVPAVRLPWQTCCPPSKSRTRLVTKLKTEKYECDSCTYKWSVEETNNCGTAAPAEAAPSEPTKAEKPDAKSDAKPDAKSDVKATIEENVVPPAPPAKGAFLRSLRRR
ncbi:hypothetical protein N9Y42_10795 [Mariniblastus sp.]|nr:hypothetical protein [Mariniblastus sp.]